MRRWMFVIGVVACSGEEPATCDGGGEPMIELGTGEAEAFAPYTDGDTFDGSSSGLRVSLWTSGLDTTQPITTVIRISADGSPTADSIAQLSYSCDDAVGNGWQQVTAALPGEAVDGSALSITISTTDANQVNAQASLTGTLSL